MNEIKKVKIDKGTVFIEYELPNGTATIELDERPVPEFPQSMQKLIPAIIEILELPDSYAGNIFVTGITLRSGKDGDEGFTISAQKKLTGGLVFNLNTPFGFELPGDIYTIKQYASDYIDGARAQDSLFTKESIRK